jgi:CubicO group peptidase (beta-lactamase class C family)
MDRKRPCDEAGLGVILICGRKHFMRTIIVLVLIVIVFPTVSASAADVAPQKIDEVFASYNKPRSAGCSVGVIRDSSFIFRKSYGEGSLELGAPLSSDSVFYMASVSKQFTAASIVLAAEQGFLSLDDMSGNTYRSSRPTGTPSRCGRCCTRPAGSATSWP